MWNIRNSEKDSKGRGRTEWGKIREEDKDSGKQTKGCRREVAGRGDRITG